MSYRQLSVQIVLYDVQVWIEFHKLLIVDFSLLYMRFPA